MKNKIVFYNSIILILLFCTLSYSQEVIAKNNELIIDSKISLTEAIGNQEIPDGIKEQLILITVKYYSFDGKLHQGQIVANKKVKNDLIRIFRKIEETKFPIAKVIPVSKYNFSDDLSMQDNNTSCFNYRIVKGTNRISNHALGLAIDINPYMNPFIKKDIVEPSGAKYDISVNGTITSKNILCQYFKKLGWKWGGDWNTIKDYQHFEKAGK